MMRRFLTMTTALVFFACGGEGTGDAGGGGDAGGAAVAALGTGTISGTISFTGSAPANPAIDMSEEEACAARHAAGVTNPVVAVTNGRLANVFVKVTGGLPAGPYPARATQTVIDQNGCLYMPRVVGVVVGADVEIRNSDSLSHNIKAVPAADGGNRPFNFSQPRAGMTARRSFAAAEAMLPLECNVHGWMQGFVNVVEHPYFATSGADGSFTITGLPPGTYAIEARHETLGVRTGSVTIGEDGAGAVEFSFASSM